MNIEITSLVYRNISDGETIAPMYVYRSESSLDTYLLIEVLDSTGTSIYNGIEEIYASIVALRDGDLNFRLLNHWPSKDPDEESYSEVHFLEDQSPIRLFALLESNDPLSLWQRIGFAFKERKLSIKIGHPVWVQLGRDYLEKDLNGAVLPEPGKNMLRDYLTDREIRIAMSTDRRGHVWEKYEEK